MPEVPGKLRTLLDAPFEVIDNHALAGALSALAQDLYQRAYSRKLKDRTHEDNRPEHELVVLRNTMRICWRSGAERPGGPFTVSELRVAVAVSLLHDLRFVPRIAEDEIAAAEKRGNREEAARLRRLKEQNRLLHIRGSAEDAKDLLLAGEPLLTPTEVTQCVGYTALHDAWKLHLPYPLASDWLAVCCFEGDALWPLDPEYGPLADLQRKGIEQPTREQLRDQAASNLKTQLQGYRASFAPTAEHFQDQETVIRTAEGASILRELRAYWGI